MLMNAIPLVLYAVATVRYAVQFARRSFGVSRAASTWLVLAVLAHTFIIGMETMRVGHVPFAGATSAISTFVWVLALSDLYIEFSTGERSMGVFILPLLVALQVIPALRPMLEEPSPLLEGAWFGIHVSSLLFAYASFALACVLGVTYILQFKEIKAKDLGFFYERLPSLQVLDEMNLRAVKVGWLFLTAGLISGAIWASQIQASGDPRMQPMSLADPKIFVAVLSWAVYSFELYAQRAIGGWRGRRAAWLSAVGFGIVLLNFVPVSYFFTKSHNF
jgi:ABC-type transport system involved in cytochrome c biogenesis permease subunit